MPMMESTGATFERVHIPSDIYEARFKELRALEIDDSDSPGKKKTIWIWTFEIASRRTSEVKLLEGSSSTAFGPKSKARGWVTAILGAEPPMSFDSDDMNGKLCRVKVEDATKEGEKYSRVTDVFAARNDGEEGF